MIFHPSRLQPLNGNEVQDSPEQIDTHWMQAALALAQRAYDAGEVPVGAVLVRGDEIIGQGWNQPLTTHDPTAHAEIIALRAGARNIENYRLVNSTLYVTIEPCTMCVGALIHARVSRLVFGASEPRAGGVISHLQLLQQPHFNHKIDVTSGVIAASCSTLLKTFFKEKRFKEKCANPNAPD